MYSYLFAYALALGARKDTNKNDAFGNWEIANLVNMFAVQAWGRAWVKHRCKEPRVMVHACNTKVEKAETGDR